MHCQPAPAEAALWSVLRGRQLGVAFRRQVLLGDPAGKLYIVDFFAPKARLVVEVDDASYLGREAQDARRDAALRVRGYRVVRIPAGLVLRDVELAASVVRKAQGSPRQ